MPLLVNSHHPWYALTVKHHHEKAVALALEGRGIEHYLPLYLSFHRSGGRMQSVMLPLFPGYVFCSFDISNRFPVLTIPSVGSIVCIGRAPATIAQSELENIETMICSNLSVTPHESLFAGQEVRIERGPLQGVHGVLVANKPNYRLVVSIPLLQRSVAAEIDIDWVRPVKTAACAA